MTRRKLDRHSLIALFVAAGLTGPAVAQGTPFEVLLAEAGQGEAGECRVLAVNYWIIQTQPQVLGAFASIDEIMADVSSTRRYTEAGCSEAFLWALTSCAPPVLPAAGHIVTAGAPDETDADAANRLRVCFAQLEAARIKPR